MKHIHMAALCLSMCATLSCTQEVQETGQLHKARYDDFPAALQKQVALLADAENQQLTEAELETLKKEAHRTLYAEFPICYDWWLQDGDQLWWFDGSWRDQLNQRSQKLGIDPTGKTDEALFNSYFTACETRRQERLGSIAQAGDEIVFTKFKTLLPSFFAYTEGLSDARHECNYFAGGELALIRMNGVWAEEFRLMEDTAGVFRDPDMHFDGDHVLFSWKKSAKEDDFHLYEMNLNNREVKTLTSGLGLADIEGIYLPDGNILFNSTRAGTSVDCWFTEVSNLFLCDRDGQYIRQVGIDQVHTPNPTLLDDGRVVYTRWDYNDRGQTWTQPLFQMNPDGTGQTEYYGMNSWFPTTVTHVRQIPGSRKIMATVMGHHNPQHGKIGIIDPEAGRDENEGVTLVAPIRKPEKDRIDSWGQYGDQFQHPFPLNESDFFVSYTPLGYHIGHSMQFGIYWMNTDGERELLVADPKMACNQPVYRKPRVRPFERSNQVDYTQDEGVYYMQDIYAGNGLKGLERGQVKKLRVVEIEFRPASVGYTPGSGIGGGAMQATPVGIGNTAWDIKKVLGEVDVETDGSAFFRVPSRKPLYFQALDENGQVIQTMRSWSTLQPGETQSCVGCHEHKNSVPLAGHPVSMAMNQEIQAITPDRMVSSAGFSYLEQVQPIWDKHCISCHDGKQAGSMLGELRVRDTDSKRMYPDSYLYLTHAYQPSGNSNGPWAGKDNHPEVNWISALSEPTLLQPYHAGSAKSNLIKRLQNGHGGTQVSADEIHVVSMWIDLLVPMIGDYREANNWSEKDHDYYNYYEEKRNKARQDEQENIRL